MKKLLITGASGFIGRHVTEQLAKSEDYDITAVISGRREITFSEKIRVEKANLLVPEERIALFDTIRPEICCHFAWKLGESSFIHASDNLDWLIASLHILRLFAENGGRDFFFAGSSSEYGVGWGAYTENPVPPIFSLYGKTKAAFEEVAQTFLENTEMRLITGRFFSAYGPWDTMRGRALPTAITSMLNGQRFICKYPNALWDYVYVQDCAEATELLLRKGKSGCYNIGSGAPITMREAFSTIAKILNTEDLLSFETNCEAPSLIADVSKLERDIGYRCSTSFTDGITQTIAWWKKHYIEEPRKS